jgi:hypothetical protein
MKKEENYYDILNDCAKIAKERQASYGKASDSLQLCSDILDTTFGIKLTNSEIALVLVALKLSREKFNKKEDNILDCINYLAISLNCKKQNEKLLQTNKSR